MQKRMESIQLWRLCACFIVFMVHFGQRLGFEGVLRSITDFGAYGVQLFFIISGFLVANSYFSYGYKNLKEFYIKKFINIMPLYYIIIAYYFIVHCFVLKDIPQDPTGFGWIRYIFAINGILPNANMYFWDNLGITWTIPYFVFAYALLPILLKFANTFNKCTALFVVSFAANYIIVKTGINCMAVLTGLPFFIMGLLIYFAYKEEKSVYLIVGACLEIIGLMITGMSNTYVSYIYGALFTILVLSTLKISFSSQKVKKILSVTDKYSYTFYLAHGVVFIHCLDKVVWSKPAEAFIAIFGSVMLTVFIHECLEKPLKKMLKKGLIKKSNSLD